MSDTSPAGYRLSEADRSFVATYLNEKDGVREEKIAELRRWLFSAGGTCTCVGNVKSEREESNVETRAPINLYY